MDIDKTFWYITMVAVSSVTLLATSWSYAVPNYRVISDRALARVEKKYGAESRQRVALWGDLLARSAADSRLNDNDLMRDANDYFNQVEWLWDIDHWGVEDYWATPIETLGTNGGDCEDYSIGKYFSLRSMGMDIKKLRITYVKALDYNIAHMVLAYYATPSAEPLILDNINKTILPASQRKDLLPVYGFNGDGLWLAKSRSRAVKGDVSRNLPSWGKLHQRMRSELL